MRRRGAADGSERVQGGAHAGQGGVFGRGMASVKIQYFVEGQLYGLFKVSSEALCRHNLRHSIRPVRYASICIMLGRCCDL